MTWNSSIYSGGIETNTLNGSENGDRSCAFSVYIVITWLNKIELMQKKRQHTVPKCYLKNFADSDGRVHVRRGETVFATQPENVLTENLFYAVKVEGGGASFVIEDNLCVIEGDFARIYEDVISQNMPLTTEDKARVSLFVAAMMLRTKPYRANLQRIYDEILDFAGELKNIAPEQRPSVTPHDGESYEFSLDELNCARENISTVHGISLQTHIEAVTSAIFKMRWAIGIAHRNSFFITSDNPVEWRNEQINEFAPGARAVEMLMHPGAEVSMPLSSTHHLLAGWMLNFDGAYLELNEAMVGAFRHRSLVAARSEIIARESAYLKELTWYPEGVEKPSDY